MQNERGKDQRKPASVILPNVAVGFVEEVLVGVELVFEEGAAEGLFDFAFALGGALPSVEPDLLHDGIDVGDDPLHDDVGVLAFDLVE